MGAYGPFYHKASMNLFLVELGISPEALHLPELIPEAGNCPFPALMAPRSATEATSHQPGRPSSSKQARAGSTDMSPETLSRNLKTHDV